MNDNNFTTDSRHNLSLGVVQAMEFDINKGIVYKEGENYIRLAFVIYARPGIQTAVFYLNGQHHSTRDYPHPMLPEETAVHEPRVA